MYALFVIACARSSACQLFFDKNLDVYEGAVRYEYVLEVPVPSVDSAGRQKSRSISDLDGTDASKARKLWFGCNVLHRRTRSGGDAAGGGGAANTYTLIATPLEDGEEWIDREPLASGDETKMDHTSNGNHAATEAILAATAVLYPILYGAPLQTEFHLLPLLIAGYGAAVSGRVPLPAVGLLTGLGVVALSYLPAGGLEQVNTSEMLFHLFAAARSG